MSMNNTVSAERTHIGFFGRRNAGKSSLVNAVTGQSLSVVSDVAGTTTDPVRKAMELLPLGPVVIIDTPGIDDEGALGALRVEKTREIIRAVHIAVLVVDAAAGLQTPDRELLDLFAAEKTPVLIAYNKSDLLEKLPEPPDDKTIYVSAATGANLRLFKDTLARMKEGEGPERGLLEGVVSAGDTVLLVMPLDESAPKGRLILPQQHTIQSLLLSGAKAMVTRDTELPQALAALASPPDIVITDSQAFGYVSKTVPPEVKLTSFSILFVRYKGDLCAAVRGAAALDRLQDGDTVLISEGCTHHRQCGDIGSVKLPAWIKKYTGKEINFAFTSGREFPEDLSPYALVIHCGGCMLNDREMQSRTRYAKAAGVPMTNYGIAIAQMHGILRRSLSPFPDALAALDGEE
ncbi:MAG: [FeFe] hydrogenase H-cluster maturation GTPase HydF [Ruminococcaceae bacterium]|nr:[FeFe] hydrogenase H-cluster maturation GTPase HydF [Oscillospiraceae bacterium]